MTYLEKSQLSKRWALCEAVGGEDLSINVHLGNPNPLFWPSCRNQKQWNPCGSP